MEQSILGENDGTGGADTMRDNESIIEAERARHYENSPETEPDTDISDCDFCRAKKQAELLRRLINEVPAINMIVKGEKNKKNIWAEIAREFLKKQKHKGGVRA